MVSLARTTSALRLRDRFTDNALGWNAGTGWSRGAYPTLITHGRLTQIFGPRGEGSSDYDGCREPTPLAQSPQGPIDIHYDAGSGETGSGWRPHIARTTDRFRSIASRTINPSGLSDGAGGSHPAVAVGWPSLWGGVRYHARITCGAIYGEPLAGLPAGDYGWDVWTEDVFVRSIPLGESGAWNDTECLPGSMMFNPANSLFYHICQGRKSGQNYKIGYGTSTTPDGAITFNSTTIFDGKYGDVPENPRGIPHVASGTIMVVANQIDGTTGLKTTRNVVVTFAGFAFTSPRSYIFQHYQAACDDVNANIVGVVTPIMGPDGVTFEEDGDVPALYDCGPTRDTNHLGRLIFGVLLRYSPAALIFSSASGTRTRYWLTYVHSGIFVQFAALYPTGPAASSDVSFEFWSHRLRIDNSGSGTLVLETQAGSVVQTGSGTVIDAGVSNRISLLAKADGTVKAWINRELQINASGLTPGGTEIAFSGRNCDAEIREFALSDSNTITIGGLNPGQSIVLRTLGGYAALPVDDALVADDAGNVEWTGDFPISRVQVDGVDLQINGGTTAADRSAWGGDALLVSGVPAPSRPGRAMGIPVFGG